LDDLENLIGTDFDDSLTGDAGDNVLTGGLGNDTLDGGEGIDTADYSDLDVEVDVDLDENGNGTVTRTLESAMPQSGDFENIGADESALMVDDADQIPMADMFDIA